MNNKTTEPPRSLEIAFINVCGIGSGDGTRLLVSVLKKAGHKVKSIFLVDFDSVELTEEQIGGLDEIVQAVDIVMISLFSHYAIRAVQITEYIHKKYPGMMVIWGGPHCISAPDISLQYADGLCFSEGDQVIVSFINKFAAGEDFTNTPSMAFNVNGEIIKNDAMPLTKDLDSLPYPDYVLDTQYLLENGKLLPMAEEKLRKYSPRYPFKDGPAYFILTARGCPYVCSYCNNVRYDALYGRNPMRFRSVEDVMGELKLIVQGRNRYRYIVFADDDFLMRPIKDIEKFASEYKKEIGLPFVIEISANSFRKDKLELLINAGLKIAEVGVQSGSQRVLDQVFQRGIKASKTLEVIKQLAVYKKSDNLQVLADFITDNPYETKEDIIQTYNYICQLPPHVKLNVFVLAFFPGTPIYERALNDGHIKPFDVKVFRIYRTKSISYQQNYETLLVYFVRRSEIRFLPQRVLRLLGSGWIRQLASVFPKALYYTLIKKFG